MSNPYRPPETELELDSGNVNEMHPPIKLSTGHGWSWFKDAIKLFMQSPLIWLVNFILLIVILMTLSVIPLVSLVAQIIGPIFIGGLMIGCHNLDNGDSLSINHLFVGFKQNASQLAGLGVIQLIGSIIILIAPAIPLAMLGLLSMSDLMQMQPGGSGMSEAAELYTAVMLYMLLVSALLIPLIMGIWFAPCLIALHNMKAWDAFKLSFKACAKNVMPFLLYGLVGLGLSMLAMIPMGLGFLLLGPVILCSMYTGYKSIFVSH